MERNFYKFKELLIGINDARKIIKDFKPDVVIGTGGYVSGPVLLAATLLRKKQLFMSKIHFQVLQINF